jgi:hypothetical protein
MTSSNEFFIIKAENRIIAIQEIRMEDDFDTVVTMIEEFDSTDLVEDRIVGVVGHVMSNDGG